MPRPPEHEPQGRFARIVGPRGPTRGASRSRLGLALLALAGTPLPALALDADWQRGALTVRDLMQAELEPARAATLAPMPMPMPAGPLAAPAGQMRLTALYGTAGRWTAVLEIGGERKVYRPGASLPVGGQGAAAEYRLLGVRDGCVVLRRASHAPQAVCFEPHDAHGMPAPGRAGAAGALSSPLPPEWGGTR